MRSKFRLSRLLAMEQISFMTRSRRHWGGHLSRARAFAAEALKSADSSRPLLILGAGWGLEIPWRFAPPSTFGWDAEPLSRLATFLRHQRWPPWIFDDATGAFEELDKVARRAQLMYSYSQKRTVRDSARRIAGLLPSVAPSAKTLGDWIREYRPGTIICANMMGQIRPMAYRIVEKAFGARNPWEDDPEKPDPLQSALDEWTARALRAILAVLQQSGSHLYLLHDRGAIHQDAQISLGGWSDSWTEQLITDENVLEVSDPLAGVDILRELGALACKYSERWIWTLGQGQIHVVEALAFRP